MEGRDDGWQEAARIAAARTSWRWVPLLAVLALASTGRAAGVLNAGTHADSYVAPAINAALGPGWVDTYIPVDYDPPPNILQALYDVGNTSATVYSVSSGNPGNHAPYGVINGSYCCSMGENDDTQYYLVLSAANSILSTALALQVGRALPAGTAPPTFDTTTSAPNSSNGGSGWGIEFGLTSGYLGLDTSQDSWNSAAMAGFLAALKQTHPTWTWFDIKAALRQTASNWPTGYSHTAFGYGFINWFAANSIVWPIALHLQPPGLHVVSHGSCASITLYPFRQARRAYEVVLAVSASYTWPVKNEYTSADLAAAGGTLIYTSNGTDLAPQFVFTPSAPGTYNLIAFTTDGNGYYSRKEEFSVIPVTLAGGMTCPG